MSQGLNAVSGLDIVIGNINRSEGAIASWAFGRVLVATNRLHKRIGKNINKTDHSLERLRQMGHPYAKRNPRNPHKKIPHTVHRQSGTLLSALMKPQFKLTKESIIGFVELDEGMAPHARWVIFGTTKMIKRDFLFGSLQEIRDDIIKIFQKGRGNFGADGEAKTFIFSTSVGTTTDLF